MKLLLHICCAPCSTATVEAWSGEGAELTGVFFNPNIHPFSEHQRRYETLTEYADITGLRLIGEPYYDVSGWLRQVAGNEKKGERCRICIRWRMEHTAYLASSSGHKAFSTSLLVSPHQEHEIIAEEGEAAGRKAGVDFAYRDLRPKFRRSIDLSRAAGLYRQNYCGCIYSEAEAALQRAKRRGK